MQDEIQDLTRKRDQLLLSRQELINTKHIHENHKQEIEGELDLTNNEKVLASQYAESKQ